MLQIACYTFSNIGKTKFPNILNSVEDSYTFSNILTTVECNFMSIYNIWIVVEDSCTFSNIWKTVECN